MNESSVCYSFPKKTSVTSEEHIHKYMYLHVAWIMDGLGPFQDNLPVEFYISLFFFFSSVPTDYLWTAERGKMDAGEERMPASESGKEEKWWKAMVTVGEQRAKTSFPTKILAQLCCTCSRRLPSISLP